MKRLRERRRQGTRCVTVEVSQGDRDALVLRGYLAEDEGGRDSKQTAGLKNVMDGLREARLV
jgi:hypothetical protein